MFYVVIGISIGIIFILWYRKYTAEKIISEYVNSDDFSKKMYLIFLDDNYEDEKFIYTAKVSRDAYKYWKLLFDNIEGIDKIKKMFLKYMEIKH